MTFDAFSSFFRRAFLVPSLLPLPPIRVEIFHLFIFIPTTFCFLGVFFSRPASSALTYLDGKAGRQAQHDEVTQLGKQGVGNGHEVDDRRHLICQRKRMGLAQPQLGFESGEKKN